MAGQQALIAFLKSLTDERVRKQSAPFDHPSIPITDGVTGSLNGEFLDAKRMIPAVGRFGGPPLKPFSEILR